jgi:hypothetical protein
MTDSKTHMIPRRFSALQKVAALAPLLLLAVYLPGQMMLRCRIDGLLRPACCCPQEDEAQNIGPVIKAQDCCDRELTAADRPVVEAARVSVVDMAWAMSAAVRVPSFALSFAKRDRSDRNWRAHGPPREGPGIVLLKHAFLI